MQLFAHPFSSYSQKALIALYENETPFVFRMLAPENPENGAEFAARWPIKRFPLLVDGNRTIFEASSIIEYLDAHYPGRARLIPADPDLAIEVRMMDRVFDNYVMGMMQKPVLDAIRAPEVRDAHGVAEARAMLDTAYAWLDGLMADREWAVGDAFTLADCAAAPALFYAHCSKTENLNYTQIFGHRWRL